MTRKTHSGLSERHRRVVSWRAAWPDSTAWTPARSSLEAAPVGHSRAAGLEVVLADRDAGAGALEAGRRRLPGLVHGGDAPVPVQHRDRARDRLEDGAVEVLRLAQPRLRSLPVERAGEDARHQLQAGEEVGRELAVSRGRRRFPGCPRSRDRRRAAA